MSVPLVYLPCCPIPNCLGRRELSGNCLYNLTVISFCHLVMNFLLIFVKILYDLENADKLNMLSFPIQKPMSSRRPRRRCRRRRSGTVTATDPPAGSCGGCPSSATTRPRSTRSSRRTTSSAPSAAAVPRRRPPRPRTVITSPPRTTPRPPRAMDTQQQSLMGRIR